MPVTVSTVPPAPPITWPEPPSPPMISKLAKGPASVMPEIMPASPAIVPFVATLPLPLVTV